MIPFHKPLVEEEEVQAVTEALRSGWLTTGPAVKKFEGDFMSAVGAPYAVALNSCTAALHLALGAVGLSEGEHVITSTMTFAATAEVASYFRAVPSLVDIEPKTMNMDVAQLEMKLDQIKSEGGKVRAIMPVHYAGLPCEMDSIMELAASHGASVIEDAAHAFPAMYKGRMIGSIGDITCFSFYATKTITTGEGGMATTANEDYAEYMRKMSLHGISKDAWKRYTSEGTWYYEIEAPGYKYNLTDLAASMGIVQLGKAQMMRDMREAIAQRYTAAFGAMDELVCPATRDDCVHGWHLYVIRLNLDSLKIDRAAFINELKALEIGTSVHFIPLHVHPYYRKTYGYAPADYPVASDAYERIISLPIYPSMTDAEVERVIESVRYVCNKHRR